MSQGKSDGQVCRAVLDRGRSPPAAKRVQAERKRIETEEAVKRERLQRQAAAARRLAGRTRVAAVIWRSPPGPVPSLDSEARTRRNCRPKSHKQVQSRRAPLRQWQCPEGTVKLWNALDFRPIADLSGHKKRVLRVAFANDDTQLISFRSTP